jgi:hypothetical protein
MRCGLSFSFLPFATASRVADIIPSHTLTMRSSPAGKQVMSACHAPRATSSSASLFVQIATTCSTAVIACVHPSAALAAAIVGTSSPQLPNNYEISAGGAEPSLKEAFCKCWRIRRKKRWRKLRVQALGAVFRAAKRFYEGPARFGGNAPSASSSAQKGTIRCGSLHLSSEALTWT